MAGGGLQSSTAKPLICCSTEKDVQWSFQNAFGRTKRKEESLLPLSTRGALNSK
jgi:hypothetical protein